MMGLLSNDEKRIALTGSSYTTLNLQDPRQTDTIDASGLVACHTNPDRSYLIRLGPFHYSLTPVSKTDYLRLAVAVF